MAAFAVPALRMKLLIDKTTWRVLFAEAGKDVVDFLFSLLALPIATAAKLIGPESTAGSVGNLFASVEALDDAYVVPGADRRALLRPAAAASPAATAKSALLLLPAAPRPSRGGERPKALYQCAGFGYGYGSIYCRSSKCSTYVTDAYGTACPECDASMKKEMPLKYVSPSGSVGISGGRRNVQQNGFAGGSTAGFVQGVVTYTVRDDLTVTPMSSISSITLLNTFGVTDLSALMEKTVTLGYAQGVKILGRR